MSNIEQEQLQALSEIRTMMQRSSKFLSLSGLSGVAAGCCALVGSVAVASYLGISILDNLLFVRLDYSHHTPTEIIRFCVLDAVLVMFFALLFGTFFTWRKAKRRGEKTYNDISLQLALNLAIPLGAGGIFCLILIWHGYVGIVAPTLLLFYGAALLHGSKFTFDDVRYLGICEMVLGLISAVYIGYGLVFWTIGFGVLHILYGAIMYYKYER